jgi:hypothetical protein
MLIETLFKHTEYSESNSPFGVLTRLSSLQQWGQHWLRAPSNRAETLLRACIADTHVLVDNAGAQYRFSPRPVPAVRYYVQETLLSMR